jgi:thioredoxin 1
MPNASFSDLTNSNTPTLVDFHAEWCGPCHMMKPILEKLKEELGDSIRIIKIDIDKNTTLANQYNVRSVPTLAVFKGGQVKWMATGVRQLNELKGIIQPYVQS